jgi:hypothetical protein
MSKPPAYDPLLDPNLRQYFSNPQVQKQLLRGGMIDESGRILSDVPGAGSKVHVINSELRRYEKDAAILAKEEADLRRRVKDLRLQKFVEEQQARRYALLKEEENIRLEITKMLRESQQGPPPPILGRPGVKEMQLQTNAVREVLTRNPEGIVSFYKEVSLIEEEMLASRESSIINNDSTRTEQMNGQINSQSHASQTHASQINTINTHTHLLDNSKISVAPVSTAPLPLDSPLHSYNGKSVWQASDFELRGSTGQSIGSDAGSFGQLSPTFDFIPPSSASSAFPIRTGGANSAVNTTTTKESFTLVEANRGLTSPSAPRQYVYNEGGGGGGSGGGGGTVNASSSSSSSSEMDSSSASEILKIQTNKRLGLMTAGEASRFGLSSASSAASAETGTDVFDRSLLATAASNLSTGSAFGLDSNTSGTLELETDRGFMNFPINHTNKTVSDSEVDDSLMTQLRLATSESQVRLPSEDEMMGKRPTINVESRKEERKEEEEGNEFKS